MRNINLHREDVKLLMHALEIAASRRESMVRANYGSKRGSRNNHAAQAERMRSLHSSFFLVLKENPGERDFHMEPRP